MAEVAGTLVSTALARARDPQGLAITRDTARGLLSSAQQFFNAATGIVTAQANLALEVDRQVYPVSALLPACVRVLSVADGTRDLDNLTDWRKLAQMDRRWMRRSGTRPEAWTMIGRDLLVVHPSLAVAQNVTVTYVKLTTALAQDTDATDTPDDALPGVLDLTELLLNLKRREFGMFHATTLRLGTRIGAGVASITPTLVPEVTR